MTREMIIEQLERHRTEFALDHGWNTSVLESLDAAIKVLKQESCDDCISRQAAIDTLIGWETDPLDEDIERELRKLPSVRPELNCKNCVFRMGYGTGIDKGILNTIPKKMKEGD